LHYHLHQADYWYVAGGEARVVLHDLPHGCPTDGRTDVYDLGPRPDRAADVFIPPGVAHGFAALTDMTITYLVDGYYNPADELGVAWDDPELAPTGASRNPDACRRDQPTPSAPRSRTGCGRSFPLRT
jgi:dTDP-4-dehydrorhamnose 3,5-epimerase